MNSVLEKSPSHPRPQPPGEQPLDGFVAHLSQCVFAPPRISGSLVRNPSCRPSLSFALEAQRGQMTAPRSHSKSTAEAEFTPRSPCHLVTSLFLLPPTARGLEHHRALGQRQFPGHPAGGHLPLPHLTLLLRLRQCRLQELQQQRDPGEPAWSPGKRKGHDHMACLESSQCWVWGRLALGGRLLVSESGSLLVFSQP